MRTRARLWIALAALAPFALVAVTLVQPVATVAVLPREQIELVQYLPRDAVTDGSVDYTARIQLALQACAGRTLVLPPFPLLVSPQPGQKHCLLVDHPIAIVGGPGSALIERTGRVQLLRVENVHGVRIEGVTLDGNGGVGQALAHGLLQVWQCQDVVVRSVCVSDADADAIAIAESQDVRVENCSIERASKAGIYLSNCTASVVANNVVRDTLGHVAPNGLMVGAGIQLLSDADLVCSSNVVAGGVGCGILCGANDLQRAPDGVVIANNRISDVSNPTNASTSGGIQLANVQVEHRTHVAVLSNSIARCGQHGILVSNHDGAAIESNTIEDAWLSGIALDHVIGAHVANNTLVDSNLGHGSGQAGVYLHPTTSACVVHGNVVVALDQPSLPVVIDRAPAGQNTVQ